MPGTADKDFPHRTDGPHRRPIPASAREEIERKHVYRPPDHPLADVICRALLIAALEHPGFFWVNADAE